MTTAKMCVKHMCNEHVFIELDNAPVKHRCNRRWIVSMDLHKCAPREEPITCEELDDLEWLDTYGFRPARFVSPAMCAPSAEELRLLKWGVDIRYIRTHDGVDEGIGKFVYYSGLSYGRKYGTDFGLYLCGWDDDWKVGE